MWLTSESIDREVNEQEITVHLLLGSMYVYLSLSLFVAALRIPKDLEEYDCSFWYVLVFV